MVCLGNGRALIQELTRATLNNVVKRVRRNDPSLTAVVWGMADGFDTCSREALAAFGDGSVFVEKFVRAAALPLRLFCGPLKSCCTG